MVLIEEDFRVSRSMAYNTCAALTVMLWDWSLCLADEFDFIWRRPHNSIIKWLYVFFKYAGLMAQGFNILFLRRMETYKPIANVTCQRWIIYQGVTVEVLLLLVDGLLILRVYAIWSCNRKILIVLVILVLLEACSMGFSVSLIAPDPAMSDLCLLIKTPMAAVLFGSVALVTQSMIIFLTVRRHLVRDGGVAFIGISAMFVGGLCYTLLGSEYADNMFCWIVCVLSICGCRIILNMDHFAAGTLPSHRTSDAVWLTSDIIVDEDEDPGI
ncbi:hypothetical protein K503DRAFT_170441 [Rhizopogon vinicolor AM-OR11-026]|uniref:DUF6533 domain-containing protein n=1 Tax=Rhizopogon vinicolor AM-OR11-026 TaxID=1314800 RepID=A0A1B7N0C4_9AGAM|nr:hypothetical protein K503DRAFT_170441 [Rhizopogon vinicolor AM-OR11-026]